MLAARLVACIAFLSPVATAADEPSLQGFLERARAQRDAALRELAGPVDEIVARLEELAAPRPRRSYEKLQQMLSDLGPEAGALLVVHTDPGRSGSKAARFRAAEVTRHLQPQVDATLTAPLLEVAENGSIAGRQNALLLLGRSTDVARVSAALAELYGSARESDRLDVFRALVQLGGPASRAALSDALASSEDELVGTALRSLTERGADWAADDVRAFLRLRSRVSRHVPELIGYLRVCPEVVDEETCAKLLDLALSSLPSTGHRRQLLEALPDLGLRSSTAHRSKLNSLADHFDQDLREGALVALALLGERAAKRKLLGPYDDAVEGRKTFATAYEARAAVFMRVRDYSSASRDFREAIEIRSESNQDVSELRLELARAQGFAGKLRQASELLKKLRLDEDDRQRLRADPAFAELIEHPRYGRVLAES